MLSDNIVKITEDIFEKNFPNGLELIDKQLDFNHMGFFSLKYRYLVDKYNIVFETMEGVFDIYIVDYENAKTSLFRIAQYEPQLNRKNIEKAVSILKNVLVEKKFDLLLEKNGKIYQLLTLIKVLFQLWLQ